MSPEGKPGKRSTNSIFRLLTEAFAKSNTAIASEKQVVFEEIEEAVAFPC